MKLFLTTMLSITFISSAFGSDYAQKKLAKAKETYEKDVNKAELKLVKAYDTAISSYTKKGDLDKALQLKNEKEEFVQSTSVSVDEQTGKSKKLSPAYIKSRIKSKKYIWGISKHEIYSDNFVLESGGKIAGYNHPNEKKWRVTNEGTIQVLNAAGQVSWNFSFSVVKNKILLKEINGPRFLQQK